VSNFQAAWRLAAQRRGSAVVDAFLIFSLSHFSGTKGTGSSPPRTGFCLLSPSCPPCSPGAGTVCTHELLPGWQGEEETIRGQEGPDFILLTLKWGQAVGSGAGMVVTAQQPRGVTCARAFRRAVEPGLMAPASFKQTGSRSAF